MPRGGHFAPHEEPNCSPTTSPHPYKPYDSCGYLWLGLGAFGVAPESSSGKKPNSGSPPCSVPDLAVCWSHTGGRNTSGGSAVAVLRRPARAWMPWGFRPAKTSDLRWTGLSTQHSAP